MLCSSCGAEIKSSANFCGKCGLKLSARKSNSGNTDNAIYTSEWQFYFESALSKQNSGDYQGSIYDWEKVIEIDPSKDPGAYYNLGLCLSEIGDRKSALDNYSKAIEMNPEFADAYGNRGCEWWIFLNETKNLGKDSVFLRNAINDWMNAQFLGDQNGIRNLKMVKKKIKEQEEFDQAQKINNLNYQTGLLSNTLEILLEESAYFYHDLGTRKMVSGDNKKALSYFNKVISIDPNSPCIEDTYLNLSSVKFGLNDYHGAISAADKVIEINPNNASAYKNRGLTKFNLEDYNGAIYDLNQSIEINPRDSSYYYYRGHCKRNLNNYSSALSDFKNALEVDPDNKEALQQIKHITNYLNREKTLNKLAPLFKALAIPLGIILLSFGRIAIKTLLKQLFSS